MEVVLYHVRSLLLKKFNMAQSSSDSSSSSNVSSEDNIHVNPQKLPESIGENNIPEPTKGSKRLEESVIYCPESTSQILDVNHAFLVECTSPTLSPCIQVVEFAEGYDPNSPASIFNIYSTAMEGNATPDDLFSIHVGESSFSTDDSTRMDAFLNKLGELSRSAQSVRSQELCQSGEIHKLRECQSMENFKSSDLKGLGGLVRFRQTSPATKGVELNKRLDKEKSVSVDVKHGEKRMDSKPMNDVHVPEAIMNNQVDTNIGDPVDNGSKHQYDRPVAQPKKRSSSKLCCCFKCPLWPCLKR